MPAKDKYTDPKLRDQVKEEVHQNDKGGAPGQWSARKAQFMAQEYKKRGGGYTTDKKSGQDESQKNLSKWTDEEWQTKEGSGEAKKGDGTRKRYLPKKAWENMDEDEKKETDQKKQKESKKGRQFVGNTKKAKESRSKATKEEEEDFEEQDEEEEEEKEEEEEQPKAEKKRSGGRQAKKGANKKNKNAAKDEGVVDDEEGEDSEEEFEPAEGAEEDSSDASKNADSGYASDSKKQQAAGHKRGRPAKEGGGGSKKQKTHGSKHDSTEAPAQQGSSDRLPKKGDRVTWRAMPGWVHGKVQEIVTSSKKVDGKSVKASKDDPRFVLKADSGKICVHKPDACYYD